jgi:hypothetical protein
MWFVGLGRRKAWLGDIGSFEENSKSVYNIVSFSLWKVLLELLRLNSRV